MGISYRLFNVGLYHDDKDHELKAYDLGHAHFGDMSYLVNAYLEIDSDTFMYNWLIAKGGPYGIPKDADPIYSGSVRHHVFTRSFLIEAKDYYKKKYFTEKKKQKLYERKFLESNNEEDLEASLDMVMDAYSDDPDVSLTAYYKDCVKRIDNLLTLWNYFRYMANTGDEFLEDLVFVLEES